MSHGSPHSVESLLNGANVHEVLDNQLRIENRGTTNIYGLAEHPDVIVRQNGSTLPMLRRVEKAARVFNRLPHHDIDCVPYIPQTHGDEVFVFTQRVKGDGLRELLRLRPKPANIEAADVLLGALGRYYRSTKLGSYLMAPDLEGIHQHMYGTVHGDRTSDRTPKARPIDLAPHVLYIETYNDLYSEQIFHLTRSVVSTEELVGQELPEARQGLEDALGIIDLRDERPHAIVTGMEDMLENGTWYDLLSPRHGLPKADPGYPWVWSGSSSK